MSKKILLADDSVTIQKVITITFASEDYDLEIVGNGDEAIEKAREFKPDIILADVAMPGKTGYEVSEIIKDDPELAHIPVILLAGTFEPLNEDEAERVRADGHIVKPFESQELIDKVSGLLEKAQKPEAAGEEAGFEVPEEIWGEGDFVGISEELEGKTSLSEEETAVPDLDFLESGGFLGEGAEESPEKSPEESLEESPEKSEEAPEAAPAEGQPAPEFVDLEISPEEVEAPSASDSGAVQEEPFTIESPEEATPVSEDKPFEVESVGESLGFLGREPEEPAEEEAPAPEAELIEIPDEPISFDTLGHAEEPKVETPVAEPAEEEPIEVVEPYEPQESAQATEPIEAPLADPVEAAVEEVAEKAKEEVAARLGDLGTLPQEQVEKIVTKVAREVIEKIAWDVVPELAQELIGEEINKFKKAWTRQE